MASVPDAVLSELKETFGRVAYTHKTHEKQAESDKITGRRIRVANVVVLGLTTAAALIAPLIQSTVAAWVAVGSALLALVFALIQLSFDPTDDVTRQRMAAKSYLALRNDYRRLLADVEADDLAPGEIRARREVLGRELAHVDRTAPQTSPEAYQAARAALRATEELTFSEEEYRHLLGFGKARRRPNSDDRDSGAT